MIDGQQVDIPVPINRLSNGGTQEAKKKAYDWRVRPEH